MAKTRAELEALRDQVLAMKPSSRLILAAELPDRGQHEIAEPSIRPVADELTAARLFAKP